MPVNKNAMTRYAFLDKLLSDRRRNWSIQDMTDYLEERLSEMGMEGVSRRQVEKDLRYLEYESPFDVEFERFKVDAPTSNGDGVYKKPCIRYADPTFSIFKQQLSDEERSMLASVLSTLGSFKGLPNFEWLEGLASKLQIKEQATILSISNNIAADSTLLADLYGAISNKEVIKLHYHTFTDTATKKVLLSPYLLKEYNHRWYLLGSPFDSTRVLSFPLDRIDKVERVGGKTYKEAPDDLLERYDDIIGITYDETKPVERITFWVSDKSAAYVKTKPIHDSQRLLKGTSEAALRQTYPGLSQGAFFTIDCRENYELIRELMMFGPDLLVLSPTDLSNKIKHIVADMHKAYDLLAKIGFANKI